MTALRVVSSVGAVLTITLALIFTVLVAAILGTYIIEVVG